MSEQESMPEHVTSWVETESSLKTRAPEKSSTLRTHQLWKWRATIGIILMTSIISGYDVSNVANIQPSLYEAFGSIETLPWIGLSYSLAVFSTLSLARKVIFFSDMKWTYLFNLAVFMIGAAVSGAASQMYVVVIGRTIMGIGGAFIQHCNLSYIAVFATPAETATVFAVMSALWAIGMVVGGPIGSALAASKTATWRWAFYINIPWVGAAFLIAAVCLPNCRVAPKLPARQLLRNLDPIGIMFNLVTPVILALAITSSGPVWPWGSGACIASWAASGFAVVAWAVQQRQCFFTTREARAIPVHMMSRRNLQPIWVASACAGATYAVALYYTPLFFAFARGHGSLGQTVRMLPFILGFIVSVLLTGKLLPIIGRYKLVYILAGAVTLSGGVAMAATLRKDMPESIVMVFIFVIGVGLGMHFQHGAGIGNIINRNAQDRVDGLVLFSLAQMGGIAGALAVAASIYDNVGFKNLRRALGPENYSDHALRQALAGVSSSASQSSVVLELCADIVAKVIAKVFYLVPAAAGLCLICGLCMGPEKLCYNENQVQQGESRVV